MYVICYESLNGDCVWEIVAGEDCMNVRIEELMNILDCDADDIMVFDMDSQL